MIRCRALSRWARMQSKAVYESNWRHHCRASVNQGWTMMAIDDAIHAVILDMDGVVTQTAKLHARAWKQMFDAYLAQRGRSSIAPRTRSWRRKCVSS